MEVSSAFVVIMGMGVTFVGLTCIIFLTILMGKILSKPEAPKPAAAAAAPAAPAAAGWTCACGQRGITGKFCPECGSPHFEVNNEKSKKCTDCGFVYYFNPSAATVALILNEKNELLVCRRAKEPAKGTLDLPGGFIDMNETGEEGVSREVLEETELKVDKAVYQFSLPNIYIYSGFPVHTLDMFFLCTVKDMSHFSAMDDVANAFFLPLSEIRPEDFGLDSIRRGVVQFLAQLS